MCQDISCEVFFPDFLPPSPFSPADPLCVCCFLPLCTCVITDHNKHPHEVYILGVAPVMCDTNKYANELLLNVHMCSTILCLWLYSLLYIIRPVELHLPITYSFSFSVLIMTFLLSLFHVQNGHTALYNASFNGHMAIVQLLLQRRANVSIRDKVHCSPQELAVC